MRKLSIKVILILTFISLNIYSQNYTFTLSKSGYIQTTTYYPTKSNPSSTITVYNNNTPYVGTQFISGSGYERDNILRTTSYINLATSLNLQANEQISLAKLTITTQSSTGSGNFNINFVGTSFSGSGPQDFWLKCKSGTNIGSLPITAQINI
ncbi:MAG: hypothetical protein H6613_13790 [Ignavibacteriales bacterium]|nr:hypothetical protein [Ignavibacteriales bacterium]